ncbi:MAG: cobalt-precorrin-5B (C(1))-methyltransferase [Chloroflexi bacterium]|nr:cobalt-precorrin-5B (C(1))-methyltransferase [Chloroflexota bacterium]
MTGRRNDRPLRSGYTTGACAAAAAQAAMVALLEQKPVERTELELPGGITANFKVTKCLFSNREASCSVVKDAGDDPDVTDGAEIWATVAWKEEAGIDIEGGKGVGVVTKPGLEIPPGMAAINPVPRQMIASAVRKAAENRLDGKGLRVVISVTDGAKLARRTLNQRLGIVGGISILGTTGIVIPYSIDAYTACISQALDVAVASGCQTAVLTTGRRSEKFAQGELALPEVCYIQAGDFIGFSLKECARKGLAKVIVWGMIGKLSKLAAGHFYTNVSDSKVDISFLSELAAGCSIPRETVEVLRGAVTATHFRKLLPPKYIKVFCDKLCQMAARKCMESVEEKLAVECILTDSEGVILGRGHATG